MKFVDSPNLPLNAGTIVIGEKYSDLLKKPLEAKGLEVLLLPLNPHVDARLSGHADLSVIHLGGRRMALAGYLKGSAFEKALHDKGLELIFSAKKQNKTYPEDAYLNICICGNSLIYNEKSADQTIVDILTIGGGLEKIKVRQGYSKCSVCVVDEKTIITSDEIIHKRAVEAGMEALKICPGFVDLDGFDYGFIGGATFKLSKNELAFTGHLENHPDKNKILNFLSLHKIKPVYITENPAFDIGSALQIVEK